MVSLAFTQAGKYSARSLEYYIQNDADRMTNLAQVVLDIAPDGSVYEHRNLNGANILAVTGELALANRHYPRALLLEIGIGRGKPYSDLYGISSRRHFVGITNDAYHRVAPHLFRIMQELSDVTVGNWKNTKTSLWLPTMHYRGKALSESGRYFAFERGKRFSISCDDILPLGDLCWSHLMTMHLRIMRFINLIDGGLTRLRVGERKRFVEWLSLELTKRMQTWGPYCIASLKHAATKKQHKETISQLVQQAVGDAEPVELVLARAANNSGAHLRIGEMHVYDATWRQPRVNMSVRTFEVLPLRHKKQTTL